MGILDIYAQLRGPLFSGFLTAGSFLFAMKQFMVVTMKEKHYDSVSYKKEHTERLRIQPNLDRYGPLKRTAKLLQASILCCFFCSVAQITIGFIQDPLAALICLGLGIAAILLVIFCAVVIHGNMTSYIGASDHSVGA